MNVDVASIERATLAAVAPQAQEELQGWLLGLDDGTVSRAHSAVPLHHVAPHADVLAAIEARYVAYGLAPVLRIPRLPCFDAFRCTLLRHGYRAAKPTLAQTGTVPAMARVAQADGVDLGSAPDAAWAAVFMGEGFDPVDGESRLGILRRSPHNVFAGVRVDGRLVAVGCACFSDGWAGVHGMRTAPAYRRRGLAGRILARLAQEAQARGMARTVLQVEQPNVAAQALYRRAGFATAWAYDYWSR